MRVGENTSTMVFVVRTLFFKNPSLEFKETATATTVAVAATVTISVASSVAASVGASVRKREKKSTDS